MGTPTPLSSNAVNFDGEPQDLPHKVSATIHRCIYYLLDLLRAQTKAQLYRMNLVAAFCNLVTVQYSTSDCGSESQACFKIRGCPLMESPFAVKSRLAWKILASNCRDCDASSHAMYLIYLRREFFYGTSTGFHVKHPSLPGLSSASIRSISSSESSKS